MIFEDSKIMVRFSISKAKVKIVFPSLLYLTIIIC